jgi:hypothetical protein
MLTKTNPTQHTGTTPWGSLGAVVVVVVVVGLIEDSVPLPEAEGGLQQHTRGCIPEENKDCFLRKLTRLNL